MKCLISGVMAVTSAENGSGILGSETFVDILCLSGCFSKPPRIVVALRRAASECPLRLE